MMSTDRVSDPRRGAVAFLLPILLAAAQTGSLEARQFRQTQTDDYTRYELLDPASHSFRIFYDVSATTAGAPYYFNSIRRGSEPTVHGVYDLMTGGPLEWKIVDGPDARALGMTNASDGGQYIQVRLARPVPPGGQGRVRIDKTYRDTASYLVDGDRIVFDRSLGIDRNAIVLPAGYELTGVNYPSQVEREDDGRLRISFMNRGPAAVPLRIEAKRLLASSANAGPPRRAPRQAAASTPPASAPSTNAGDRARVDYEFSERAFENREIVYFLQQPETHAFRLYHDYTETRPGVDRYVNVVRAGSKASNPSAILLDTGEKLKVETLKGEEITRRGVDAGRVTPETEVVVIWFDAVKEGGSARLRIEETYTDGNRYVLAAPDELVWDRAFGRARNTVILPDGWYLTTNAVPAVIDQTAEGLSRLRCINDRPGEIEVFIRARRR